MRLNEGYRVLHTLREAPACCENAKRVVFGMIRQLEIPAWFFSFSAEETILVRLLRIINITLFNKNLIDEGKSKLSWAEKMSHNQIRFCFMSKEFQLRMSNISVACFKRCVLQLEKKDYFCRVEFQQRGLSDPPACSYLEEKGKKIYVASIFYCLQCQYRRQN